MTKTGKKARKIDRKRSHGIYELEEKFELNVSKANLREIQRKKFNIHGVYQQIFELIFRNGRTSKNTVDENCSTEKL